MNTAFLIDGFNFYYALKTSEFKDSGRNNGTIVKKHPKIWRWFDYQALCKQFLQKDERLHKVVYFTALAINAPSSKAKHQLYISVLEDSGIHVILGKYKNKTRKCFKCGHAWTHPEEKATDVNIAIEAYALACLGNIKKIYVVSGDTDYLPAMRKIENDFPDVKVEIIFPLNRHSEEYIHAGFTCHKTSINHIQQSLLPRHITLSTGQLVERPREWAQ